MDISQQIKKFDVENKPFSVDVKEIKNITAHTKLCSHGGHKQSYQG